MGRIRCPYWNAAPYLLCLEAMNSGVRSNRLELLAARDPANGPVRPPVRRVSDPPKKSTRSKRGEARSAGSYQVLNYE